MRYWYYNSSPIFTRVNETVNTNVYIHSTIWMESVESLHPPVQRYGYFSHDYNYIGRRKELRVGHPSLHWTNIRSICFLWRWKCVPIASVFYYCPRGIDRPTIIEWITLSLRSVLRIRVKSISMVDLFLRLVWNRFTCISRYCVAVWYIMN